MKDEIKELIEALENVAKNDYIPLELEGWECQYLLDYITNLQEENEYSNYCNEELRKKITNLEYKIKLLEGDKDE